MFKPRVLYACLSLLLYFLIFVPSTLLAEHTRTWRQASYDDFLKGNPHGVAVRSDGRLELAPKFTLVADVDASYLWSLRVDPKGALYASGGSPAKVFRFDGGGKPATVFESTDLVAQAIAFDAKSSLYVATSPDGKVYRVSASGEKNVFFDPKTKYIWDLAFAPDGTLYVATGDKGQIFAVSPDGKGELFYSSDEAHIRALAFDAHNNLVAGTEPSGRILRVTRAENNSRKDKGSPSAQGFVLYETAKREVTSITVSPRGVIYTAAIGACSHNHHHYSARRYYDHRRRRRPRRPAARTSAVHSLPAAAFLEHLPPFPGRRTRRVVELTRRRRLFSGAQFRWPSARRNRQQWRASGHRWPRRFRTARQGRLRANHRHGAQRRRQAFPVHRQSRQGIFRRPRIRTRRHLRIALL